MTPLLADLHQQIQSDDWQTALAAADAFAVHGSATLPLLLPLLTSPSSQTRDAVALALREIAAPTALEPLVDTIRSPATAGHRGTLVYALETLNCSNYLLFLFDLALTDTFEVQNHALTILFAQQFRYDLADLETAQAHLDAYMRRADRPTGTDVLLTDMQALLTDLRHQAQV